MELNVPSACVILVTTEQNPQLVKEELNYLEELKGCTLTAQKLPQAGLTTL